MNTAKSDLISPCPPPGEAILDTQAILDWLHFADPITAGWEASRLAGDWVWVISPALRDELCHVLQHGHLPPGCRPPQDLLALLASRAREVGDAPCPALPMRWRCSDPDDQKFLDLAQHRGARWLVSRDKAVLKLRRRALLAGVHIVRPGASWWRLGATP
ncbi:PIN domain-containing protein [Ideonella livida]|uniref:PIN domain-containing protein n=1 Tax=Ideonella livida TaxID=2707176 RepID=A0A7C9PHD8_9BURK|nr:PIN domain-containing protein [Ideonella livida]NDY91094.1 PIN domain-containing protein [Ideonella livida]